MATTRYPTKTTLAIIAAKAPAYVEFPLNIDFTVMKYVPSGTVTRATVKNRSFAMTEVGTAGRMSDGPSGDVGWSWVVTGAV